MADHMAGNAQKMRSGDGNGLSEAPKHLYIPWMTFNDDLNEFLKIMKNHIFCPILPSRALEGKIGQKI